MVHATAPSMLTRTAYGQEGRIADALEWLLRAGETDLASLAAAPLLQRIQQSLEESPTASKGAAHLLLD